MTKHQLNTMLDKQGLCAIHGQGFVRIYDNCGNLVRVLLGDAKEQNKLTIKTYLMEYKRQQKADRKKNREMK